MNIISTKKTAILIPIFFASLFGSCSGSKKSTAGDDPFKNMVIRMGVEEPIEGVCDNNNVIAIMPSTGNGQVKAVAPKTKEALSTELNANVTYLKDNPTHDDKGMVNLVINCKGELVRCQIDNKTKDANLDQQIVAVFATMKKWTVATLNDKPVDSAILYSFTIKKGKIILM